VFFTILYVVAAVVADGCAALTGGLLPERWLERSRGVLVGFAAGVLLGTTLLDLLPGSLAEASGVVVFASILGSLSAMAFLEWAIGRRSPGSSGKRLAATLLGADAFHNMADGAAIAASFLVTPRLGIITAVAVVVHEVPEELADYVLLRNAGLTRARSLLAMTGVQLTAAIGAAVTLLSAAAWRHVSGVVLAVAAGTFLYIAVVDLMPSVWRSEPGRGRPRVEAVAGLLAGLALTVFESFW
jgi:zinc and cadmium transporter